MPDHRPVVLITGAAGAVGSAVAGVFAEAGYALALFDRGEDATERLRRANPDAFVFDCDLTDGEAVQRAVDDLTSRTGRLDAALCIAGGFGMQPATEATPDDFDKMMGLNVRTLFNTARAALPAMQERGSGFLAGIAAQAADEGGAGMALYAASKGAVAAYCKSLDAELAANGIRATALYPMGAVDTPANRDAMPDADPDTWVSPQEIGEHLLHLARRSSRGHTPVLKIHAGGTR